MTKGSCEANLVDKTLGGGGVLTRSSQQEESSDHAFDKRARTGLGCVGEGCDNGIRNRLPPLQAMGVPSQPLSINAILDVADLVDRLSHVHVSKSSNATATAAAGVDDGDDDKDDAAECDEVVEHTETTHDETLSVAGNGRAKSQDRHDNGESVEDVSVMTGSFGYGESAQHLGQQWQGPKRPRYESDHAERGDDDTSGDASGFSLDAMVGHSSCESSVTWFEGSHIDEITVDEGEGDDRHDHCDDSHEDVILQCLSSSEETGDSDVEVVVYEDDETMFESTSTESFFGEDEVDEQGVTRDNISLEQPLSSSSASSCTSPLSSPSPPPQLAERDG